MADLALSAGVELIPKPTPVGVEITFFRPRPKRVCRVKDPDGSIICAVRPDIDNLMKAVLDGLDGVAWQDDGQICDVVLRKRYHAKDAAARTVVRIEAIEDEVDR